jgi:hypothetical protein
MTVNKGKNKMGDANIDISHMSPSERAKLSTLIEKDGDADLREHLLGALGRSETARGSLRAAREVPSTWSIVHVLDRLEEAFQVMAMMPAATRPKAYGSAWPGYNPITPAELIGIKNEIFQAGGAAALSEWESEQNQTRDPPSSAQITRMEQALRWPFEYLRDWPELAKAISQRAMWAAMRVDIRRRCERRGINHDEFNVSWQEGLNIITAMLIARKVPVS